MSTDTEDMLDMILPLPSIDEQEAKNAYQDFIANQVSIQVRNQVEDQVEDQVQAKAWNYVRNQVDIQVGNQFKNQVEAKVRNKNSRNNILE